LNLMPSGAHLMEDFYYAGGIPAVMKRLADRLRLDALTVSGGTVGDNIVDAEVHNDDVIRPLDNPLVEEGGLVILRGNLAPGGAVLKPSAASPELLEHVGRAVVFDDMDDYRRRIADPALPIDATSVMVLRNCGPKGYPGMAEVGNMGLPPKLLEQGVRDLVRISDARMSGTAYGTVVLHVAPEAAAGGPLALVREGDEIVLSVRNRTLSLNVPEAELARRRAEQAPPAPITEGGYRGLYRRHVMQADTGADFDFLRGCRGAEVPEESH
ncbi:dihydroxy-acid dehydratase, partial [Rhizobiaceae sp. 2RAB30]